MSDMHLAQLNVGRLRAPIDSPEIDATGTVAPSTADERDACPA